MSWAYVVNKNFRPQYDIVGHAGTYGGRKPRALHDIVYKSFIPTLLWFNTFIMHTIPYVWI